MQLRWLAVGGQVVTILFVDQVLRIALPLGEMMLVLLLLVVLNLASLVRHHRVAADVRNGELFGALLFDLGALTTQLYLSGGASNPFIFLYLLQIGLAAVLLEWWSTWVLVALSGLCFVLLMGAHQPLALPVQLDDGVPRLYLQGVFVCFLIAAGLLPHGEVDERSILYVEPADLRGFLLERDLSGMLQVLREKGFANITALQQDIFDGLPER